ncbi:MAG: TetR/AcrR family transcriptional regulator [Nostocoides sp.]
MNADSKNAARHAELLDVAISLFYEKGYAHTTLQDIADHMGFTKAAIYYYAKNKEELLIENYAAIVEPATAQARQLASVTTMDGAGRFESIIDHHLRTFLRNIEANAVFEVQSTSLSPAGTARIHELGRAYDTILRGVYQEGIDDGSLVPAEASVAVNAVIGMCNSVHRWFRPKGRYDVDQVIDQLLSIITSGVRRTR